MSKSQRNNHTNKNTNASKKLNTNLRWVVGVHACLEALRVFPNHIKEVCFVNPEEAEEPLWREVLKRVSAKPIQRKQSFFNQMTEFGHQGVAVGLDGNPSWPKNVEDKSLFVFLDQVGDPQNLGAILRTSWLMEADGIGVTERRSVSLTPTACKVASGGAEHVPVEEFNFISEIKDLQQENYWVYGFSDKAEKSLYDMKFSGKTVFVFGSEEKGLRSSVENACDELISIPQAQAGASYNVSVSVAIALSEFNRQTRL